MFQNEGIIFDDIFIDKTFPHENAPTRKPGIAMLSKYLKGTYDLKNSYVIGDRFTDVELAKNIGCKVIYINQNTNLGNKEITISQQALQTYIALETNNWQDIAAFLKLKNRYAEVTRKSNETDIQIKLSLDGNDDCKIKTGLAFFDHMLEQLSKHAGIALNIVATGDLQVDEHHLIEDTAIVLGEAFLQAMGNKTGMARYGFLLPMDDCLTHVAIDFGGRPWLVWDAEFKREKIGDMPTEMFYHFFKSFTDSSKCNLNIKAEGLNEHHKIEAIFKAFAKAIKMAIQRDSSSDSIPSTKGII
jgi:imidazoleglycerol-phosphate dehydratase/histidinol-phosphatase